MIQPGRRDAPAMRAAIRQAYRCDCDGVSQGYTGRPPARARLVDGDLSAVDHLLGVRPAGCPWRALSDRDVIAVMAAHDWMEAGSMSVHVGPDPERWLVDGVMYYHRACAIVTGDCDARAAKSRAKKAPRLPVGDVIDRITG